MANKTNNEKDCPTFLELIRKFHTEKAGIFINGMGLGKITQINGDYITFEVVKQDDEKLTKETTFISLGKITTISEGEKEVPKSEEEKGINNALEDL